MVSAVTLALSFGAQKTKISMTADTSQNERISESLVRATAESVNGNLDTRKHGKHANGCFHFVRQLHV